MKRDIKFEEWLLFCSLVSSGSFAATARETGVDPSNIKKKLDVLEQKLNQQLFLRDRNGLQPTVAARRLYSQVLPLIESTQQNCESFQSVESFQNIVTSRTCAMPAKLYPGYGERISRSLREKFPNVSLLIHLYENESDLNSLEANIVLLCSDRQNIGARMIGEFPTVVAASQAYIEEHGEPSSPEDLSLHTILHTSLLTHSRTVLINGSERYPVPIKQEHSYRNEDSLITALTRHEGIAIELTRAGFLLAKDICPLTRLLRPARSSDIPLAVRIDHNFVSDPICLSLAQLFSEELIKERHLVSQLF